MEVAYGTRGAILLMEMPKSKYKNVTSIYNVLRRIIRKHEIKQSIDSTMLFWLAKEVEGVRERVLTKELKKVAIYRGISAKDILELVYAKIGEQGP